MSFYRWLAELYRYTPQPGGPGVSEYQTVEILAFNEGDARRLMRHNYPDWQVEKVTPKT